MIICSDSTRLEWQSNSVISTQPRMLHATPFHNPHTNLNNPISLWPQNSTIYVLHSDINSTSYRLASALVQVVTRTARNPQSHQPFGNARLRSVLLCQLLCWAWNWNLMHLHATQFTARRQCSFKMSHFAYTQLEYYIAFAHALRPASWPSPAAATVLLHVAVAKADATLEPATELHNCMRFDAMHVLPHIHYDVFIKTTQHEWRRK